MKSNITSYALALTMLLLAPRVQAAKKNLLEGFVITNAGDTLRGHIQFVNPVYNELKVRFYQGKKRQIFKPKDLVEYALLYEEYDHKTKTRHKKWVHFFRKRVKVVPLKGFYRIETVFLQQVVAGELNLYRYYTLSSKRINNRSYEQHYFLEQKTPDGFDLTHIDRVNFRELSKSLLAENQFIMNHLGRDGFGFKHLPKLVQIYNGGSTDMGVSF